MKPILLLTLLLAGVLLAPPATLSAGNALSLTQLAAPARVELATAQQKLVFTQTDGVFVLSTFVRDGQAWRAMFNAGRPLLAGPLFDLQPTRYAVLTHSPERKAVEFSGQHPQPEYHWTLRVEATADSPLFRFVITCQLPAPLSLKSPQPVVALWLRQTNVAFQLDQGPDSIYGSGGISHGYGFPAAYLWDAGREAAVFFNMTPMRWMQRDGVARFNDVRIMTRSDSGQTGLGLHFKKLSGRRLPAGTMVIEFFLYQDIRPLKPTGLEALDTMVRTFAPLHPSESGAPRNQLTGEPAKWEPFARRAMNDLMTVPQTMTVLPAPWHDAPLELVPPQEKMIVHSGGVRTNLAQTRMPWDFSTVNNHLTPWLLLARVYGDDRALQVGLQKKDALPRFYDPRAQLIRHGTRQPPHVGNLEMSWQNFFFHEETLRAASATGAGDFNPAVAGRFLMAMEGLRALAREVDYVFPQWFDPYQKQPVVQNDVKQLGKVREPWQAGTYAWLMWQAFDLTGEKEFLSEAQRSIETLLERMHYRVQNEVYDREYREPAEFPITELFGNAYGIAAAYRLYEATGNAKLLHYSHDFMNTLLRLTFWYEDESDPASRELHNAGLFYPHAGAHVATPWETTEAHLMIAWTLKHDPAHPLTDLLLKLSNLNRKNSFYFFPATWTAPVRALHHTNPTQPGQYFPVEPFYCLEGPGGHHGQTAAYMAGMALWNAWLYEALAEASNSQIMVLNLDVLEDYEAALSGVERHFLVYNPTPASQTFRVVFKHLAEADSLVLIGEREETHAAAELRPGWSLTLPPGGYQRLTVRRSDYRERQRQLQDQHAVQNALVRTYQLLQARAAIQGPSSLNSQDTQTFAGALAACRDGRPAEAEAKAKDIRLQFQR